MCSVCGRNTLNLHSKFSKWGVSQNSIDLTFGNCVLMHAYLCSGFPAVGTPRASPPPSVCMWRKSVSESASGTWSRMVAWEQISCSCVYLVLTVHTGFFSLCPWVDQHVVSLLRAFYLPAPGLKVWRHTTRPVLKVNFEIVKFLSLSMSLCLFVFVSVKGDGHPPRARIWGFWLLKWKFLPTTLAMSFIEGNVGFLIHKWINL